MTSSVSTAHSPSGFACFDASFATNFDGPIPTEHPICCSSATSDRTCSPTASGEEKLWIAPLMSQNASSMLVTSTCAETDSKIATMPLDTSVYVSKSGGIRHELRPQPARGRRRHAALHAVLARLVRGRQHHPARRAADEHRPARPDPDGDAARPRRRSSPCRRA